jgi:predicted PolB exonuclease-like 3'-5' exonuclease
MAKGTSIMVWAYFALLNKHKKQTLDKNGQKMDINILVVISLKFKLNI